MSLIYNADLIGKKISVVDEILLLNPYQTPLISLLGFDDPVTQVEHVWYEDELFPTTSKLTAAIADGAATSAVVADVTPFRVDQVIRVNDELMLITGINTGTKTLTVVRGFGGSTAAAQANNSVVEVLFNQGKEGQDARAARYKQRVRKSNVTQIFDDSIEVSGTADAVTQYGIDDLYEYEKQKKQLELALSLEKALIGGIYYDNGTDLRTMRGIRNFITTNVIDGSGAAIDLKKINDAAQAVYEAGGFQTGGDYVLLAGATQKRNISQISNTKIQITQSEKLRGQVVEAIATDFGQFPVILNNNLKPDEVILLDTQRAKIRPLQGRAFFHKFLGDKGDYTAGMVVGEYTLEFKEEKAHARIRNLSTTITP